MPKFIKVVCLKNVNNQRNSNSTTGVLYYPLYRHKQTANITDGLKALYYHLFSPLFSTLINTYYRIIVNLLNKSFTHYPQYLLISSLKEN